MLPSHTTNKAGPLQPTSRRLQPMFLRNAKPCRALQSTGQLTPHMLLAGWCESQGVHACPPSFVDFPFVGYHHGRHCNLGLQVFEGVLDSRTAPTLRFAELNIGNTNVCMRQMAQLQI